MKKTWLAVLAAPLFAVALGACTVTVHGSDSVATVSTGVTVRYGVPVSDIITVFEPTRGAGATYYVGDQVQFRIDSRRRGYVTLVIWNPEGRLDSGSQLQNIPVDVGTNYIPRSVRLSAAPPTGRSYIRAYFTGAPVNYSWSGSVTLDTWNSRGTLYFRDVPQAARDIAETTLVVR